jgi:hypothetical protein
MGGWGANNKGIVENMGGWGANNRGWVPKYFAFPKNITIFDPTNQIFLPFKGV